MQTNIYCYLYAKTTTTKYIEIGLGLSNYFNTNFLLLAYLVPLDISFITCAVYNSYNLILFSKKTKKHNIFSLIQFQFSIFENLFFRHSFYFYSQCVMKFYAIIVEIFYVF